MFKYWLCFPALLLVSQVSGCAQEPVEIEAIPVAVEPEILSTEWELFSDIDTLRRQSYCPPEDYIQAKADLIEIYEADVADRKSYNKSVSARDLDRRERLSKITAKGCLFDQDDYWMAALIFQHGQLPEHFLRALAYANRAVEMKKAGQGSNDKRFENVDGLQQVTIDRYLQSLGYKQLFGTQITSPAFYKPFESEADGQPCIWPLDKSFDIKRDYTAGNNAYRQMLDTQLSAKLTQFAECDFPARDSKHLFESLMNIRI